MASQSLLAAQRAVAGVKGGSKGKGSRYQKRVAEVKGNPIWAKAVSNVQHLVTQTRQVGTQRIW